METTTATIKDFPSKVQGWITEAEALGLVVTLTKQEYLTMTSVTCSITRPQVAERNLLALITNLEAVYIHSIISHLDLGGKPNRWKTSAILLPPFSKAIDLTHREIGFYLQNFADTHREYLERYETTKVGE